MELWKAIELRTSRRTYQNKPVEAEKLNVLLQLIEKLNKESGLTMQLVENAGEAFNGLTKSYGMFKGVRSIVVLKGKSTDRNLQEKTGYYGEYIVLEATRLQLGTCWVGASFDKQSLPVAADEEITVVITIGHVTDAPSVKENFIRKMAHGKTKPLSHFYTADAEPPQWFIGGVKAAQKAPSAINRQAYQFHYENGNATAWVEGSKKFDMIDLGIAKAHFVIAAGGKFEWGNNAKLVR